MLTQSFLPHPDRLGQTLRQASVKLFVHDQRLQRRGAESSEAKRIYSSQLVRIKSSQPQNGPFPLPDIGHSVFQSQL